MEYEFYVMDKSGEFFPYKFLAVNLDDALYTLANLIVSQSFDFGSIGYCYYVRGKTGQQSKRRFTSNFRERFFDYYEIALLSLPRT